MHRFRTSVFVTATLALALTAAACSDDDSSSGTADTTATTAAAATTVAATTTMPPSTLAPVETVAPTAPDGPVQIDAVVGVDSGEDRVEYVQAGEDVTLNITNPDAADEFHIHGIDLEQEVAAGVMATFNFTADTPGTYEVESHVTEAVLVVIVVQ